MNTLSIISFIIVSQMSLVICLLSSYSDISGYRHSFCFRQSISPFTLLSISVSTIVINSWANSGRASAKFLLNRVLFSCSISSSDTQRYTVFELFSCGILIAISNNKQVKVHKLFQYRLLRNSKSQRRPSYSWQPKRHHKKIANELLSLAK